MKRMNSKNHIIDFSGGMSWSFCGVGLVSSLQHILIKSKNIKFQKCDKLVTCLRSKIKVQHL